MSKTSRADEIRKMVRVRVADALLDGANGRSEALLKEVFEYCDTRIEIEVAKKEARRLAKIVRKP